MKFEGGAAELGPVSVLINNAGIAVEKLAVDQTEADWDSVVNANLKGAYFAATEMARRMMARKQEGNIVNIASVLGFGVMKFLSPYTISKAGIVQATKAMRWNWPATASASMRWRRAISIPR